MKTFVYVVGIIPVSTLEYLCQHVGCLFILLPQLTFQSELNYSVYLGVLLAVEEATILEAAFDYPESLRTSHPRQHLDLTLFTDPLAG